MSELNTEQLGTATETTERSESSEPTEAAPPRARYNPVSPVVNKKKSFGQILFYVVAGFCGLLLLDFLVQVPRWLHESHVRRVQRVVDTITPDSVLARCGQPLEDVTTDLYPMVSRRMTFNSASAGSGKVVLFFSRTSEENSQWLYSSMREEGGKASYNTPDEQMAALPCLARTK